MQFINPQEQNNKKPQVRNIALSVIKATLKVTLHRHLMKLHNNTQATTTSTIHIIYIKVSQLSIQ